MKFSLKGYSWNLMILEYLDFSDYFFNFYKLRLPDWIFRLSLIKANIIPNNSHFQLSWTLGLPCLILGEKKKMTQQNSSVRDPDETGGSHLFPVSLDSGHRRLSRISEYTWFTAPLTWKVGVFDPAFCSASSTVDWLSGSGPVLVILALFLVDATLSGGLEDWTFST
ncbi:hypothetical protein AMECASPLE_027999 [Ameca splendens]|uniref:Uncharacterized protein n=1 Tax=Ameca splendens TaxID=208324 RepID=A0ABV1A1J4_9TELE